MIYLLSSASPNTFANNPHAVLGIPIEIANSLSPWENLTGDRRRIANSLSLWETLKKDAMLTSEKDIFTWGDRGRNGQDGRVCLEKRSRCRYTSVFSG